MSVKDLPAKLQAMLDEFTGELGKIYGEGLISVILYGSAASGEYLPHRSNVNLLIVLNDAGLTSIGRSYRLVNKRCFTDIKPIFFTERYIQSSLDTFPVEFLDMKENHIALFGKDILSGINIDTKNLRFQCEQELKSKILLLKAGYLKTEDTCKLKEMLFKVFTSSLHILRNLIRIKGHTPPYLKEEIIASIENNFGVNGANFNKILQAKRLNTRLTHAEVDLLLTDLTRDLEQITDIADRM